MEIRWEYGNRTLLMLLVPAWTLDVWNWGPLMLGALRFFFFPCWEMICQVVVAEVEHLRVKGYDPRIAACMFV